MADTATARSEDEILEELHDLDEQRQGIRARMLELNEELNQQRARADLDRMTEGQRNALLQIVRTEGIASEERFGQ